MHGYTDELAQAFGESIIALIERVQLYMEHIFLFIHICIFVLFYVMSNHTFIRTSSGPSLPRKNTCQRGAGDAG